MLFFLRVDPFSRSSAGPTPKYDFLIPHALHFCRVPPSSSMVRTLDTHDSLAAMGNGPSRMAALGTLFTWSGRPSWDFGDRDNRCRRYYRRKKKKTLGRAHADTMYSGQVFASIFAQEEGFWREILAQIDVQSSHVKPIPPNEGFAE